MIYCIIRHITKTFLSFYNRLSIEGNENIDNKKQYIFAANHFSFLDLFIMIAVVKNVPIVGFKSDYFNKAVLRLLLSLVNGIPLNSNALCKDSIKLIIREITEGKSLIMSPAGKISKNGKLQEFKDGVSFIAFKTKTPVVPVAIINSNKALPYGKVIPRPYKIWVKIGNPVITESFDFNRERIKRYTETMRNEISLLLNQEHNNEKIC